MVLRVALVAFLLSLLVTFVPEPLKADHEITGSTELPLRFTASWAHHYYSTRKLNMLELQWKFPEQHSIIKTSIGGSKKRLGVSELVEGDLNAHFLGDILSIELPQEYSIEKISKTNLWQATIDYEYYWSIVDGSAWKFPYDLYLSAGIGGLLDVELGSNKYNYKLHFDADQDITGTISIPGTSTDTNFSFFIPSCLSFDFSIVTVKGCGFFNLEKPKQSSGYWGFGFGF